MNKLKNDKPILIGLSGKKQSGKSSIADFLAKQGNWVNLYWAEPLKEIIGRQLFDLSYQQMYGVEKEIILPEWGMSPREILQKVGTELFRKHFRDDFWVVLGKKAIKMYLKAGSNVVVSDCRFPNEMEAIRELGGAAVRVTRTDMPSTDTHTSETSLDYFQFDHYIAAISGDMDTLYKRIGEVIKWEQMKQI